MPLDHNDQLKELAFTVLRDLYGLGDELAAIHLDGLAERIRRIHAGLNPEKEFHALVSWLGQCTAVYAIEDAGGDEPQMRAPDYLLVRNIDGQDRPVLVEVKTTEDDKLIWSESYLSSLRRFADLLRLPLLVAWKRGECWTLVDSTHFERRAIAYHLTFERAMKQNLMALLCGELMIALDDEFQFILEADVAEPLPPKEQLLPEAWYTMTITGAWLCTKHGRMAKLENEFFWLSAACTETNHVARTTQQTIRVIHHPEPGSVFPLTRVLLAQLAIRQSHDEAIDWNAELRRRPFPSSGTDYRNILRRGIDLGIIRHVFHQRPQTTPEFLS